VEKKETIANELLRNPRLHIQAGSFMIKEERRQKTLGDKSTK